MIRGSKPVPIVMLQTWKLYDMLRHSDAPLCRCHICWQVC